MTDKRDITPQEQLFLDYLFDGDVVRHPEEAKQLAGYPKDFPVLKLIKNISKELLQKCDDYLALYAPQGIMGILSIMNDPNEPGSQLKLKAIIELLDRAGVVKKEKSEVAQVSQGYLFYLPPKTEIKE